MGTVAQHLPELHQREHLPDEEGAVMRDVTWPWRMSLDCKSRKPGPLYQAVPSLSCTRPVVPSDLQEKSPDNEQHNETLSSEVKQTMQTFSRAPTLVLTYPTRGGKKLASIHTSIGNEKYSSCQIT